MFLKIVGFVCFVGAVVSQIWRKEDYQQWDQDKDGSFYDTSDATWNEVAKRLPPNFMQQDENFQVEFKPLVPQIMRVFDVKHVPGYCSCDRREKMMDLGLGSLPRYYGDMQCVQTAPCGPNFSCQPTFFNITVLRFWSPNNKPLNAKENIPRQFKGYWTAEKVPVTIDCECRP